VTSRSLAQQGLLLLLRSQALFGVVAEEARSAPATSAKIRVLFEDHKRNVGLATSLESMVQQEQVGVVVDMPNSLVALAMQKLAGTYRKIAVLPSADNATGQGSSSKGLVSRESLPSALPGAAAYRRPPMVGTTDWYVCSFGVHGTGFLM
jgi:hypothetical protein